MQTPASDGRIRKTSVQPAHLPGQMVLHHLPLHPHEADVRGSRPLRGIWKMSGLTQAFLDRPSTPSHPVSLQTDSPGFCSAAPHFWTHRLASGAHNAPSSVEDTSSTISNYCHFGFMLHSTTFLPLKDGSVCVAPERPRMHTALFFPFFLMRC